MTLKFREMVVDDLPAVLSLRLSTKENAITMEELENDYGITPESLASAMHSHVKGWLCEEDEVALGFSMGDASNAEVQVVAVHPSHEGRGIGKTLLNHVKDWLFSQNHHEIWLNSNPDTTTRAYGFYRKLGWQPTGKMNGEDEILVLEKSSSKS